MRGHVRPAGGNLRKFNIHVDTEVCSGCGICAGECPTGAITVRDTAEIDAALCTGCGRCITACPSGALAAR